MNNLVLKDLRGTRIETPTILVDRGRALANIERMARRAREGSVVLRPHFKTHRSAAIGSWFRDFGVTSITVSSLSMAAYFADHGWTDQTVAFPANLRESGAIRDLSGRIDLGLLVDSVPVARGLDDVIKRPVRIWMKIDAGMGRAGIRWDRPEEAVVLARTIAGLRRLRFEGLLTHSGHSYFETSREGLERVHRESVSRLLSVREALVSSGLPGGLVSIGDTPTCSVVEDFEGVDEIRPGNFVFYDLMQVRIGSCAEADMAVVLAAPVAGVYPDRSTLVLYGGAVHLSKERLEDRGRPCFGVLADADADGLAGARRDAPVVSLSQEHGVVALDGPLGERIEPGGLVAVHPVHACLALNLHGAYRTFDGETLDAMGG